MEIRIKNMMYLTIMLGLFIVSCKSSEQKLDPFELCSHFYDLNKNVNMNDLMNVQILGIREHSEYDNNIQKYNRIPIVIGINDSISKENIKLPVFSKNATLGEQRLFFARCDSASVRYLKSKYKINISDDLFKYYIKDVEFIYSKYYQIKVPNALPYTNIEVDGCGNYIEFVLYKNDEKKLNYRCYYVRDTLFSNDRIKDYFNGLPKFDNHWYYDIN